MRQTTIVSEEKGTGVFFGRRWPTSLQWIEFHGQVEVIGMPPQKRLDVAAEIYHALNRGNAWQEILHKDEDDEAFERGLGEGFQRSAVRFFSFTLMPNH